MKKVAFSPVSGSSLIRAIEAWIETPLGHNTLFRERTIRLPDINKEIAIVVSTCSIRLAVSPEDSDIGLPKECESSQPGTYLIPITEKKIIYDTIGELAILVDIQRESNPLLRKIGIGLLGLKRGLIDDPHGVGEHLSDEGIDHLVRQSGMELPDHLHRCRRCHNRLVGAIRKKEVS